MQLGLPAVLLQGLAAAGGQGAAAAPAEAAVDAAAVTSPIAGNLHAWKVADGDTVQAGRRDRRDGGHEDGDAGDGTPRWAHQR
jgi:hypothetical protein